MRRPRLYLATGAVILLGAAAPVVRLALTPGSSYGIPRTSGPVQGFDVLRAAVGPGAAAPVRIVVDTGVRGGAAAPAVGSAVARLVGELRSDPEVAVALAGRTGRFVADRGRYLQVLALGRHDYGQPQSQSLVKRIRSRLIPRARFPATADVIVGGGPAQGVDFLQRTYEYVPWLILAVLALTYVLLLRAFRSVVLPLKAVILNLLSVAASFGVLVIVFRYGVGHHVLGLYSDPQVEGWIPPFLFATLFGLSMDYEVFLVTRMREAWDSGLDNASAVAHGLERTGRIITAAAIIMVAAFSGFVSGRIVGLQEFGVGLASAVLIDATVIRSILVPSLMALFGRWNWWLPAGLARLIRVEPSSVSRL